MNKDRMNKNRWIRIEGKWNKWKNEIESNYAWCQNLPKSRGDKYRDHFSKGNEFDQEDYFVRLTERNRRKSMSICSRVGYLCWGWLGSIVDLFYKSVYQFIYTIPIWPI